MRSGRDDEAEKKGWHTKRVTLRIFNRRHEERDENKGKEGGHERESCETFIASKKENRIHNHLFLYSILHTKVN